MFFVPKRQVEAKESLLDAHFPEWGQSPYYEVELTATMPQKDVLAQLYVLVPVLDDEKHYYVGDEEIDKVMRGGKVVEGSSVARSGHRALFETSAGFATGDLVGACGGGGGRSGGGCG